MLIESIRRRGTSLNWVIGVIGFSAGIVAMFFFHDRVTNWVGSQQSDTSETERSGSAQASNAVTALGRIEPASGVRQLMGPPGDRVVEIRVSKGDMVNQGDTLAVLESLEVRRKDLDRLAAQEKDVEHQRNVLTQARDVQLQVIDRQIEQGEISQRLQRETERKKLDLMRKQLDAARQLRDKFVQIGSPTIPAVKIDEQTLAVAQLDTQIQITEAALVEKEAAAKRELENARDQKITLKKEFDAKLAALPSPELLEQQRSLLQLQQRTSIIKAPIDGMILDVAVNEGDPTGIGPIFQMANLSRMVVRTEVYEDKVPLLRRWLEANPGKSVPAEITSRAFDVALGESPSVLKGKVTSRPGKMVGKNRVMPLDPIADADARVVEVIVEFDDRRANELAGQFVGMQVNVRLVNPTAPASDDKVTR